MNINKLKHHFFNYIDKTEYMTAVSIVAGTIITALVTGYSNYLDDRNNRIKRLNEKPLNNIWVNYITEDEYQRIIDKKNWKPASLRSEKENINIFQKERLLYTVNKWLANQVRKKTLENEVNPESLIKLAKFNNKQIPFEINDNSNQNNNFNYENQNLAEQDNIKKNGSLPPEREKNKINYKQWFPFKKTVDQNNNIIVGKIAGKDIKKDANIFESLAHIWRTIFFYKKEKTPIKKYHYQYKNKAMNKTYENVADSRNLLQKNNDYKKKHNDNFLIPTFIIDGNLQEMDKYVKFKEIASDNNLTAIDLKMLAYLQYTLEKCWYDKFKKKYQYNPIDAIVFVTYTQNAEISDIKIDNLTNIRNEISNNFIQDITQMLSSCKIENVTNLTRTNYNLWGKIKIKFNMNKHQKNQILQI